MYGGEVYRFQPCLRRSLKQQRAILNPKNCLLRLTTQLLWKYFLKDNMVLNSFVLPSQLAGRRRSKNEMFWWSTPCHKKISEFFCVDCYGHPMLAPIFCLNTVYFPIWWIIWHFGKNVRVLIQFPQWMRFILRIRNVNKPWYEYV